MTAFRFEHEFRGDPAAYWRLFFDDGCLREQYDRIGVRAFEVREFRDEGDTITRTVHVIPARELPAVVRKLTGASFGYDETSTLFKRDGYADTTVVPTTLAHRISITGRHTLDPAGPGRFTRVFEGQLGVAIPLVGRRIERTILEDMTRSYAVGAEITQAWLDKP